LSKEEQNADPEKRSAGKAPATDTRSGDRPRDAQACERYALYRQAC
jgi:hypothetical protein